MDNIQDSLLWETATNKLCIIPSSLDLFIPKVHLSLADSFSKLQGPKLTGIGISGL